MPSSAVTRVALAPFRFLVAVLRTIYLWRVRSQYRIADKEADARKLRDQLESLDPLLTISAVELARRIRSGEVTSEAVVSAYVARCKLVNPLTNSIVADAYDATVEQAKAVDTELAAIRSNVSAEEVTAKLADIADKRPFLGVPITIKESFSTKGFPWTCALSARANAGIKGTEDAHDVACLKDAGFIILGVTAIPTLCMAFETHSKLYGRTNNPYRLGYNAGGSSGGEGSIVGAAGSVIGLGSDVGGSLRMPAFFNGVWTIKSSPRLNVFTNLYPPLESQTGTDMLASGPIARYATDLYPFLRLIARRNEDGSEILKNPATVDVSKLRFVSVEDNGFLLSSRVTDELVQAQREALAFLATITSTGVAKTVPPPPEIAQAFELWGSYLRSGEEPYTKTLVEHKTTGNEMSLLWEPFKLLLGTSDQTFTSWQIAFGERFMTKEKTPKIEADFEKMYNSLMALLGDDDNGVLLYPSHSNAARPHGHTVFHVYDFIYTGIFNVTGLPALTVPMGVGKDGLPVGFQLVAKKGNEHVLLKLAEVLEKQFGGWVKPHFVQ